MEENQLKILGERINNAISFIENLKSKEKALVEEKESLEVKTAELEEVVHDRDLKIEALQENQMFLKNKIEAILDKLEMLAGMEGYEDINFGKTESANGDKPTEEQETVSEGGETGEESSEAAPQDTEGGNGGQVQGTGEIIIEENLVDLKTNNTEQQQSYTDSSSLKPDEEAADAQEDGKTIRKTTSESEKTLFNEDEDAEADNQSEGEGQNNKPSSDYSNPFIET